MAKFCVCATKHTWRCLFTHTNTGRAVNIVDAWRHASCACLRHVFGLHMRWYLRAVKIVESGIVCMSCRSEYEIKHRRLIWSNLLYLPQFVIAPNRRYYVFVYCPNYSQANYFNVAIYQAKELYYKPSVIKDFFLVSGSGAAEREVQRNNWYERVARNATTESWRRSVVYIKIYRLLIKSKTWSVDCKKIRVICHIWIITV